MNKRISLIIGGVLAILAVVLVRVYLNQQRQAIKMQEEQRAAQIQESQVTVLVANTDIPPGTILSAEMVDVAVASAYQVPPQTAGSYSQVVKKETVAPIAKGEPITLSKLASTRRSASRVSSLSKTTPQGKRAITIPVDQIASVGGMVKPGDSVDVICSISVPTRRKSSKKKVEKKEVILSLFQNVLVLAVGTELSADDSSRYATDKKGKKKKPATAKMITLALSPSEANLIAFAEEQGKIQLVLRSPGDVQIEPVGPASWDTILQYLDEEPPPPEKEAFVPDRPEKYQSGEVEVYHGLKREIMPIFEEE